MASKKPLAKYYGARLGVLIGMPFLLGFSKYSERYIGSDWHNEVLTVLSLVSISILMSVILLLTWRCRSCNKLVLVSGIAVHLFTRKCVHCEHKISEPPTPG